MIKNVKDTFLADLKRLNVCLLPQNPDAKWCSFLIILEDYGVTLPQNLLTPIERYVVFPNDKSRSKQELLSHPVSVPGPGSNELSLGLTREISLKELSELVHGIEVFQKPLTIRMLIFFKLNHSVMFDKYLRVEIEQAIDSEAEETKQQKECLSVDSLQKSLQNTHKLLMEIMNGEATYADIIAQGKLDLKTLDLENEFSILKSCFLTLKISQSKFDGLAGVRSFLELFQYTKHIPVQKIEDACEQYHLNGCLKELEEIKSIVKYVESEGNRSKLTSQDASEKMKQIKTLFCLTPDPGFSFKRRDNCLDIFHAVSYSTEFYQFIRDKQFYGQKGQVTFHQQYQLITAQLQHEEYDESVLNHLLAAFNVMTPFLDQKQSFKDLMTKITRLDTTIGLKQLETVNSNITLIRLWFSRAEVSDDIMGSPIYLYKLTECDCCLTRRPY